MPWRSLTVVALLAVGCSSSSSSEPVTPVDDASSIDDTGGADVTVPKDDTAIAPEDGVAPPLDVAPFDAAGEPKLTSKTFTPSSASFLNPERGWFDGGGIRLVDSASYDGARAQGFTLVYGKVMLDKFRTTSIDAATLTALRAGFARVRKAGIKVVLRFVYNDGSGPDASEAQVIAHINQLAPVIAENADVIAIWQGGFIGLWGEWHGSTNGLETPASRKKIMDAILAALPKSRMTQIRTPHFKAEQFPKPLLETAAFDGSNQARIGHHNDCFLASDDDTGTYKSPVETWKSYIADDARFVPVGGESCRLNPPRTDCPSATKELERLHWSFYNVYWHPDVYKAWGAQKCQDEIGRRLGYRLVLDKVSFSEKVKPGGVLQLKIELHNEGYASMYNPRPVEIILDTKAAKTVRLGKIDPRRWEGGKPAVIDVRLRIPADVAPGKYALQLMLPDEAPAIAARPEYAVRFANESVWDDKRGTNMLTDGILVDPTAEGSADPTATTFAEVP